MISKVCQEADILYVSWIYDSPHITLYSPWVRNSCNLIFSFDKVQSQELKQLGVTNVFHLPLAVNVPRLDQLRQTKKVIGLKQKNMIFHLWGACMKTIIMSRLRIFRLI